MGFSSKWLSLCGAALVLCSGQAHAQSGTLLATLDASDPQATTFEFNNSAPNCTVVGIGFNHFYEVRQINVSTTGLYEFRDNVPGTDDGFFGIYSGPFNPADLAEGCVLSLDDISAPGITLTQGVTYNMMFATFNYTTPGNVGVTYTGPGTIMEGAAVAPAAPVPTMTEWAIILLGLALAGGAAVLVQRRRMTV